MKWFLVGMAAGLALGAAVPVEAQGVFEGIRCSTLNTRDRVTAQWFVLGAYDMLETIVRERGLVPRATDNPLWYRPIGAWSEQRSNSVAYSRGEE